jgi:hypothetical protein
MRDEGSIDGEPKSAYRRWVNPSPRQPSWQVGSKNRAMRSRQDEPLVELETDKVTVEVPAPASGTLGEIRGQGRRHR